MLSVAVSGFGSDYWSVYRRHSALLQRALKGPALPPHICRGVLIWPDLTTFRDLVGTFRFYWPTLTHLSHHHFISITLSSPAFNLISRLISQKTPVGVCKVILCKIILFNCRSRLIITLIINLQRWSLCCDFPLVKFSNSIRIKTCPVHLAFLHLAFIRSSVVAGFLVEYTVQGLIINNEYLTLPLPFVFRTRLNIRRHKVIINRPILTSDKCYYCTMFKDAKRSQRSSHPITMSRVNVTKYIYSRIVLVLYLSLFFSCYFILLLHYIYLIQDFCIKKTYKRLIKYVLL